MLDGQHQNLFRLAPKFHAAVKVGKSAVILSDLLDALVPYTHMHFQQEESNQKYVPYLRAKSVA